MDVRERILENVRRQGAIKTRLDNMQKDADKLTMELQRLGGQIELLGDLIKEDTGMDLQQLIDSDEGFKMQIAEAGQAGNELVEETVQRPAPQATTMHSSNKVLATPTNPEPEEPEIDVVRTRQPHKIVVTDGPPTEPDEDEE